MTVPMEADLALRVHEDGSTSDSGDGAIGEVPRREAHTPARHPSGAVVAASSTGSSDRT
jgi:hypothetical protein